VRLLRVVFPLFFERQPSRVEFPVEFCSAAAIAVPAISVHTSLAQSLINYSLPLKIPCAPRLSLIKIRARSRCRQAGALINPARLNNNDTQVPLARNHIIIIIYYYLQAAAGIGGVHLGAALAAQQFV
jgi:hypothetical protein